MRKEIPEKTRANSVYTSSPGSEVQIKQCEGVNILGKITNLPCFLSYQHSSDL